MGGRLGRKQSASPQVLFDSILRKGSMPDTHELTYIERAIAEGYGGWLIR